LGVEGGLRTHRGDLVCFARHRWWVCWVARRYVKVARFDDPVGGRMWCGSIGCWTLELDAFSFRRGILGA
jgi:hypothetical protein